MITRATLTASVDTAILGQTGGLARRKPRLLLRLSGAFLLRFAERTLSGSLFQEPPRKTRDRPRPAPPREGYLIEQPLA